MDREITEDVRRRRITRRVATAIVAVAAIAFSLAATVQWLRPGVKRGSIQTARVERGPVDATLQASGTVIPATEQVVSSPVEARVLRIVRRAGDRVKAGDEVIALDTSATRLDAERLADRVAQKESEEAQLRLSVEETIATLRAQIEQKKLDREIVAFKAEQTAKLSREGLVTTQENLAAATAVKKVDIELSQLGQALGRAQRNGEAKLAASSMELRTMRKEFAESNRQVGLAMMRADRDGVVTWAVQDAGATIRRGDVVARIADLSSFRVTATISDVHAAKLSAGMPARVRLDDATLVDGTIAGIDPRIENGTARFYVDLAERSHAKLRNNLRVDVFVVTGRRPDALRVRRGALGQGEREEVFVVRGDELLRVPAEWGLAGEETIEVKGGLREGDEVVISNMNDYAGVKKLRFE
jgi:HlyD family secretion protein